MNKLEQRISSTISGIHLFRSICKDKDSFGFKKDAVRFESVSKDRVTIGETTWEAAALKHYRRDPDTMILFKDGFIDTSDEAQQAIRLIQKVKEAVS